ncbi:endoplasmic reticulum vesicle transporter-domain-containing protein [Cyathus striatus]|nr:endoplasmic reticulum vesicle transporter-domain-containing protein [Cyathus striatus]
MSTTSLANTTHSPSSTFSLISTTYKPRSESHSFFTHFVCFVTLLFVLNDIGEYIWGWADDDLFTILTSTLRLICLVAVNLSVDLRDAIGDTRLMLSGGFRRDGTKFDVGEAITLKYVPSSLTPPLPFNLTPSPLPISQIKRLLQHPPPLQQTKLQAHLHVQRRLRLVQNLRNVDGQVRHGKFAHYDVGSWLVRGDDPYQYFLHVVSITYTTPRSTPLHTHQYSVTHYTRTLEHNRGTPGIFFKFDIDPLSITIHQRTTSLLQLFIRVVGVVGVVFVCVGYGLRVSRKVGDVVSGKDKQEGLVAAQASGAHVGLRAKWSGAELRSRNKTGVSPSSSPWYDTGSGAGAPSPYAGYPGTAQMQSPYLPSPSVFASQMGMPAFGPGPGSGMFSPGVNAGSPATPLTAGGMLSVPPSPMVNGAAPGVNGNGSGPKNIKTRSDFRVDTRYATIAYEYIGCTLLIND